MSSDTDLAARAAAFFAAVEDHDWNGLRAMLADDVEARQHLAATGLDATGPDALVAFIRAFADAGIGIAYSQPRRVVGEGAVAEQHVVTLTRPDGTARSGDVCVVLRFDGDGLISRLDEYVDPAVFGD